MKINVDEWQNQFTGELAKTYFNFKNHLNKEEYIQACKQAEKFMEKFIELYTAINLMKKAGITTVKSSKIDKGVADFR
jgi:hypothetical protein